MWTITMLTIFLLTTPLLTFGVPIASPTAETKQVPLNPKMDVRGLFHDFYTKQIQGDESSTSETEVEDFGEKFTSLVAQTAVAMADAGQETAHQIIGTMGHELGEALKF